VYPLSCGYASVFTATPWDTWDTWDTFSESSDLFGTGSLFALLFVLCVPSVPSVPRCTVTKGKSCFSRVLWLGHMAGTSLNNVSQHVSHVSLKRGVICEIVHRKILMARVIVMLIAYPKPAPALAGVLGIAQWLHRI